jgi:hypothetical protein
MTPEHIMQTRSIQSIFKRVFGFNYFKFSLIILKPVNLLYELGFQTDICSSYDSHNILRYINSYKIYEKNQIKNYLIKPIYS